jgi:hypothetical protein
MMEKQVSATCFAFSPYGLQAERLSIGLGENRVKIIY